ncbi:MAG: D-alanyl-D-alanine carboxypeptidase/D-alanyl-D-alanine-endopeptidase [Candidatus Acidiferrales bacterium]
MPYRVAGVIREVLLLEWAIIASGRTIEKMMNSGILPKRCAGLILAALLLAVPAGAQSSGVKRVAQSAATRRAALRFAKRVDTLLAAPPANQANWGILVADAKTGEALYAHDEKKLFIPASNMKLFTTALALATLGPEYRFHTTLETRARLLEKGRLDGDLVLVGRGDPNLSNRKFPFVEKPETDGPPEKVLAELADKLVARGVREIGGDIVADDSYFPPGRYAPGWEIDDMVWEYGTAVSAIAVDDNTTLLTLSPGTREGDAVSATVEPKTEDFAVENGVTTSAAETKSDLVLTREPGARLVVIRGTLPAGSAPRILVLAIEEPAEHAAGMLKRLLEERGVHVGGCARAKHAEDAVSGERMVLAEHISPPLAEALVPVNKMSINLHTEMLLKAAVRQQGPWKKPEEVTDFAWQFYRAADIEEGDLVFTDGSGLSRGDLVTPRAVVTLLRYAQGQAWFPVYFASLPVAGQDGTLEDRMKDTQAAGRVHAKTGSHEHVAALSGYAETLGGREVVFSIFANNALKKSDAATTIDAICAAMVEELGGRVKKQGKQTR